MKNTNDLLFIHKMLKNFADSMTKVFIPILVYQFTSNIYYTFLYVALNHLLNSILFFALKKLQQKYSIYSVTLFIIPSILEFVILTFKLNIGLIILACVLDSISTVMYYGASNIIFVSLDKTSNVAKFEAGGNIGTIIFTIISAYLLGEVADSQIFIFIGSSIFYILSCIPLIICSDKIKQSYSERKEISLLSLNKSLISFNILHCCTGVFSCFVDFILPFYVYLRGYSFSVVGILLAGKYLLKIIASYLGNLVIIKKLIKFSNVFNGTILVLVSIGLLFIKIPIMIYILTLVMSFSYQMIFTTMFKLFIEEQRVEGDYFNSLILRDSYQNFARSLLCGLYFIIPFFSPLFIAGAVSSGAIITSGNKCLQRPFLKEKY